MSNPVAEFEIKRMRRGWPYRIFMGCLILLSLVIIASAFTVHLWPLPASWRPYSNMPPGKSFSISYTYDKDTATTTCFFYGPTAYNLTMPTDYLSEGYGTYLIHSVSSSAGKEWLIVHQSRNLIGQMISTIFYLEYDQSISNRASGWHLLGAAQAYNGRILCLATNMRNDEKIRSEKERIIETETVQLLSYLDSPSSSSVPLLSYSNIWRPSPYYEPYWTSEDGWSVMRMRRSTNADFTYSYFAFVVYLDPTSLIEGQRTVRNILPPNFNPADQMRYYLIMLWKGMAVLFAIYYLLIFPIMQSGVLHQRVRHWANPELRILPLNASEIIIGILSGIRPYWTRPICILIPSLIVATISCLIYNHPFEYVTLQNLFYSPSFDLTLSATITGRVCQAIIFLCLLIGLLSACIIVFSFFARIKNMAIRSVGILFLGSAFIALFIYIWSKMTPDRGQIWNELTSLSNTSIPVGWTYDLLLPDIYVFSHEYSRYAINHALKIALLAFFICAIAFIAYRRFRRKMIRDWNNIL